MIRFIRNDTKKAQRAIQVLQEAKEKDDGYNKPEVNEALIEMFKGKCYICESKDNISSYQIEHLRPHRGDLNLKYDWDNLFWSCAHCNNIKSAKYEPILDCSKIEADKKIAFRKEGFFGTQEKFVFVPLDDNEEINHTVSLLQDAYYGTTPQKKMEATNIRKALRRELSNFKNLIREYEEAEAYDKEDLKCAICREVKENSAFTAFKRWILWDNKEKYKDLIRECEISMQ